MTPVYLKRLDFWVNLDHLIFVGKSKQKAKDKKGYDFVLKLAHYDDVFSIQKGEYDLIVGQLKWRELKIK